MGRGLLAELIPLGYTGSLTNLQRFLNPWRRAQFLAVAGLPAPHLAAPRNESPAHPAVPPIAAAALCIKPRGQLTDEQAAKVDMLKATSTEFASMRGLAMRFRGILKGESTRTAADAKISALGELPKDAASCRVDEFADGRFMLVTRQPMPDGGWLATHEDITERKRAEAEIVHLARHDGLTGLANRAEFNAKLEEASKRLKRNGGALQAIVFE